MSIRVELQARSRSEVTGTRNRRQPLGHLHALREGLRPLVLFILVFSSVLFAQQPAGGGTVNPPAPDSPQPQQPAETSPIAEATSTFIGYATNRSFFFPTIATSPDAVTPTGKFKLFVNESISPPTVITSVIGAAYDQARDVPTGFGQGWDAYASRFGWSMARSASSSFFGTFVFASVLHQDPRFFPQYKPTFWGSVKYSAQRIVVTRNDSGKNVFNSSGLLGPLAGEALANVYLPQSEQTVGNTLERYASDLGWRFGGNMFKNYWPTLFRNMGLNRLKVIPDPGKP